MRVMHTIAWNCIYIYMILTRAFKWVFIRPIEHTLSWFSAFWFSFEFLLIFFWFSALCSAPLYAAEFRACVYAFDLCTVERLYLRICMYIIDNIWYSSNIYSENCISTELIAQYNITRLMAFICSCTCDLPSTVHDARLSIQYIRKLITTRLYAPQSCNATAVTE